VREIGLQFRRLLFAGNLFVGVNKGDGLFHGFIDVFSYLKLVKKSGDGRVLLFVDRQGKLLED
jgi:hypothetical protein